MSAKIRLTMLAIAALAALAGCTTAQNVGSVAGPNWDTTSAQASSFKLDVLPDSYAPGGTASGYNLTVDDYGKDIVVNVNVSDARSVKALYFKLAYDASQFRPLSATPTHLMGDHDSLLSMTYIKDRGTVTYGQVLTNYEWRTGFSGGGTVAQVEFRKEPAPLTGRTVSAVPANNGSASVAVYDDTNTSQELSWDYANKGDYDQNGLINISDLTPLGAHFGQSSPNPPSPFDRSDNRSVIDGDGNGVLNISDLTPLGADFGNGISGYNVYETTDNTQLPVDNTTPSPVALRIGSVPFSAKQGNANTNRLTFGFDLTSLPAGAYYWVRPYEDTAAGGGGQDVEGTPSNVVGPGASANAPNLTVAAVPPGGGDGSSGTPYIVNFGDTVTLLVTDPTDGDVSTSGQTTYSTSDSSHVTFVSNVATIGNNTASDFTISATYKSVAAIPVLHFHINAGGGGGITISPTDTLSPPWSNVPNIGTANVGTSPDNDLPYILHDSTFNPDAGSDGTYDLVFPLKAQDSSNNDIDPETLTWSSFPPFVALDVNDTGTKGQFHANQFSVGYISATNGTDTSNFLYVQVKLDQS